MDRFRVGVNYWPATSAMRWWRRFDAREVERDFARIAGAGLDSVRLFLLWEDFQPRPDTVDQAALDHLRAVADSAQRHALALIPTLFTGHMSGANWLPRWAVTAEAAAAPRFRTIIGEESTWAVPRNWYADPGIAAAQALLARSAATALRGHDALWAWDLGNENSNVCVPPDREAGRAWLGRMAAALREGDAACRITLGLHMEDLEEDRRLGPAEAATVCDVLSMHGYPLYAPWAGDPLRGDLLAFLTAITRWLGGKPVLFEEFGAATGAPAGGYALLSERAAATFTGAAIDALRAEGAVGALLWCHADYAPAIWGEPPFDHAPHERSFGLWRADGSPKAAVAVLGARARGMPILPAEEAWIDLDPDTYWQDPGAHLRRLYARYRARRISDG